MKYKSPLLTSATGSVGGLNASHNKGGSYFRAKPKPRDRPTPPRNAARSALGAISSAWETLSDTERQSWNAYASATRLLKSPGSIHQVSGYHHFVRSNTARLPIGDEFSLIKSAPGTPGLPPELVITNTGVGRVSAGPLTGRLAILIVADVPAAPFLPDIGNWVLGYIGNPFNVGKSSYHLGFTFLSFTIFPERGETPFSHVFTTNIFRPTTDPFKIQMKLVVSLLDGRTSNPLLIHASFP